EAVASPRRVDSYFLVDRSSSLAGEIVALRENLPAALDSLRCPPLGTGTPGDCVPELWSGAGGIGFDGSGGQSFENYLDLQPDPALTASSINTTTPPGAVETQYLALWSTLTGSGSEASSCTVADPYADRVTCEGSPAGEGGVGYPCFREDAQRTIIMLTDEAP